MFQDLHFWTILLMAGAAAMFLGTGNIAPALNQEPAIRFLKEIFFFLVLGILVVMAVSRKPAKNSKSEPAGQKTRS